MALADGLGTRTNYTTQGSPWEYGYGESFNDRMRDEQWRVFYNTFRPHNSLGYRRPAAEIPEAIEEFRLAQIAA